MLPTYDPTKCAGNPLSICNVDAKQDKDIEFKSQSGAGIECFPSILMTLCRFPLLSKFNCHGQFQVIFALKGREEEVISPE